MAEIIVCGTPEFTLGFKLAGIRKAVHVTKENANQEIKSLLRSDAGVIVTQNSVLNFLQEDIKEQLFSSVKPSVVVLSKESSNQGLRNMIKKSIGIDLG